MNSQLIIDTLINLFKLSILLLIVSKIISYFFKISLFKVFKISFLGFFFVVICFFCFNQFTNGDLRKKILVIGKVPSFELTDQNNNKISDKTYLGKVYVVEFFFANCLTICPIMNKNLVQVQDEFYGNLDFGIASITIDPEHDTPAFLKEHAKTIGVKHPNWHLLSGNSEYIMNLANKGFYIQAGKDAKAQGGFGHSGQFALIDKEGNIRSRKDKFGNPILFYDGIEQTGVDALKEDIKLLLKE